MRDARRLLPVGLLLAGVLLGAAWLFVRSDSPSPVGLGAESRGSTAPPDAAVDPVEELAVRKERAPEARRATTEPLGAVQASYRGVVVDLRGVAVAGAKVSVSRQGRWDDEPLLRGPSSLVTGSDGRFAFEATDGPEYLRLSLAAKGFVVRGSDPAVTRGRETKIVLVPACPLRIVVLDSASGAPVEGASLRVVSGAVVAAAYAHAAESPASDEGTTDAAGRAVLSTEGGPAQLYVNPREHAATTARGLNVPPEGSDLEVRVVRGGIVEARVTGPDGKPVAGARARLDVRPAYRREASTDAAGVVRFGGVPLSDPAPDEYTSADPLLVVVAPGLSPGLAQFPSPAAGETHVQEIVLQAPRSLSGRVLFADARPLPGVTVLAEPRNGPASDAYSFFTASRRTDAEGRFRFEAVTPGAWGLLVKKADGGIWTSASVQIAEAGSPPPVDVVLPDDKGVLVVRVLDADGEAVAGAHLDVASVRGFVRAHAAEGTTDAQGRARIEGLAREAARLLVEPAGSGPIYRQVSAEDLAGREIEVRLGTGEISGRVLHLDGTPARATLYLDLVTPGVWERGKGLETDVTGAFRFHRLLAGAYHIQADEDEGVLAPELPPLLPGAHDVEVWLAAPSEASRLHLSFLLVDGSSGAVVPAVAWTCRARAVPVAGTRGTPIGTPHGPETSAEGRFVSMGTLPPGRYDVTVSIPGWRPVRLTPVEIPGNGEPSVLKLDRGARIAGRVRSEDGSAVPDAVVEAAEQTATTASDGSYTLSGLPEGVVEVRLRGEHVFEATKKVTVTAATVLPLDWTAKIAGALRISIEDVRRPRGDLVVRIHPEAGPAIVRESKGTDDPMVDGVPGWRLDGVSPGRYRIEVTRDGVALPTTQWEVIEGDTSFATIKLE